MTHPYLCSRKHGHRNMYDLICSPCIRIHFSQTLLLGFRSEMCLVHITECLSQAVSCVFLLVSEPKLSDVGFLYSLVDCKRTIPLRHHCMQTYTGIARMHPLSRARSLSLSHSLFFSPFSRASCDICANDTPVPGSSRFAMDVFSRSAGKYFICNQFLLCVLLQFLPWGFISAL